MKSWGSIEFDLCIASMESIRESYVAFLMRALVLLDASGRDRDARGVFDRIRVLLPSQETAAGLETFLRELRARPK